MTTHSDLVTNWPLDLAAASIVTSAAQVYFGERAQKVTRAGTEVWIERLDVDEQGRGFQGLTRNRYRLHVRVLSNTGGDLAAKSAEDTIEALQRSLVSRYNGTRPFTAYAALSSVSSSEASEEGIAIDPENEKVTEGTVLVSLLVKG